MSEKINLTVLSIESITSLEDLRKKMGVKKKYFYRVLFSHDKFYREIEVPKRKSGQFRKLSVPSMALKNMQRSNALFIETFLIINIQLVPCMLKQ